MVCAIIGMCSPMLRARDLGLDRLELAANVGGRIRLGVPDVDMAGPALQEDHDDVLGVAEAARAGVLVRDVVCQRCFLREEEAGEMKSGEAERADAHQLAASWAFTGASGTSRNIQHDASAPSNNCTENLCCSGEPRARS